MHVLIFCHWTKGKNWGPHEYFSKFFFNPYHGNSEKRNKFYWLRQLKCNFLLSLYLHEKLVSNMVESRTQRWWSPGGQTEECVSMWKQKKKKKKYTQYNVWQSRPYTVLNRNERKHHSTSEISIDLVMTIKRLITLAQRNWFNGNSCSDSFVWKLFGIVLGYIYFLVYLSVSPVVISEQHRR